jgi:hypothetical protein
MVKLTNNCSDPYKHIDPTCCAKFSKIKLVYSASSDTDGRTITLAKSPYDGATLYSEQAMNINYGLQSLPQLSSERPATTQTSQSPSFNIDPDILKLAGIVVLVIIAVVIWILRGKDE